jgi:hypothetical protein
MRHPEAAWVTIKKSLQNEPGADRPATQDID